MSKAASPRPQCVQGHCGWQGALQCLRGRAQLKALRPARAAAQRSRSQALARPAAAGAYTRPAQQSSCRRADLPPRRRDCAHATATQEAASPDRGGGAGAGARACGAGPAAAATAGAGRAGEGALRSPHGASRQATRAVRGGPSVAGAAARPRAAPEQARPLPWCACSLGDTLTAPSRNVSCQGFVVYTAVRRRHQRTPWSARPLCTKLQAVAQGAGAAGPL